MAGKKLPVDIVIGAVDNATLKAMEIGEHFEKAFAPLKRLGGSLSLLSKETGLSDLGKGLGEFGHQARETLSAVGEFGVKFAAAFGLGEGAIYELMHSFAESGEQIKLAADRLGLTTNAYQELAFAANHAGVDQESFNSSMTKFTKNATEAAMGTGEAFKAFEALRISTRDAHGQLRPLEQLLPEVADKLSGLHSQNLKNTLSMMFFGREGAKLNGMFKDGAKGLEEMRKRARELGGIMTPDQLKEADELNQTFKDMGFIFTGLKNTIGAALGPALEKILGKFEKYIQANKAHLKAWAEAFGDKLPGYVDQVSSAFEHMVAVLSPVGTVLSWLADMFGGVNLAMLAVFTWAGGFTALGSILKLGWAFKDVLGPGLRVAWVIGGMLADTFIGLGAALVALVGWPVLLGAAFVAAAVAIWKWWDPLIAKLEEAWDWLKKITGFGGSAVTVNTAQSLQNAPSFGPPLPFLGAAAASPGPAEKQQTELKVTFDNLPRGSRVETKKADVPVDLTMGYAYPHGGM